MEVIIMRFSTITLLLSNAGMPDKSLLCARNLHYPGLQLHRAPMPEEEPLEPLPGEEPTPDEEEPPPHPDPSMPSCRIVISMPERHTVI
jgi:hypothetical protein